MALTRVLYIGVGCVSPDAPLEIPKALQEDDWLTKKEAGKRIGHDRKTGKHKKTVGRDSLQRVDLQVLISASEFEFVAAMHPAQRSRVVKSILICIARSGNRIANGGIAGNLDRWRTDAMSRLGLY